MCGGGGGGGFDITDPIDWKGAGETLASVDPGPAIGEAGASIDKAVNDNIPGGWAMIGAIVVSVLTAGTVDLEGEALAAETVAVADETAVGMGYSSAAEAMQAGVSAETLGLPAATTTAQLGATAGSASQGFLVGAADQTAVGMGYSSAAEAINAGVAPETLGLQAGSNLAVEGTASQGYLSTLEEAAHQALPYSETYDAINMAKNGYDSATISQNLAGSGVDPFLAQDMAQLASQGLSPEAINQALQYSYSTQELAPLGLESLQAVPETNSAFQTIKQAKNAYDPFNKAKQLGQLITGDTLSGLTGKAGTVLPGATGALDLSANTSGQQQTKSPLDLTANITQGNTNYSLGPTEAPATATTAAAPVAQPSYAPTEYGMKEALAAGGSTNTTGNSQSGNYRDPIFADNFDLSPVVTKGNIGYHLPGYEKARIFADGGSVEDESEHNPTFYSEGGLNSLENTYVKGDGDGTSDSVEAMLANGEFVIPADCVSDLGNGSNDAGAKVLDEFLATIRAHKQKHDPKNLPPDSKGPLAYLLEAKKKAKA